MGLFIESLWTDPLHFFMISLIVIFSICLHEFMHAWTALRFGDSTAADLGYLTLNPLRLMGPMSLIIFLFLGIAWGSVPVDPLLLRSRSKYGELLTSLAGPLTNLGLFLICWTAFALAGVLVRCELIASTAFYLEPILLLLLYGGIYNFTLFVFNMIPAPGFDGWNLVQCLFPGLRQVRSDFATGITLFIVLAAVWGISYIFGIGAYLMMLSQSLAGQLCGAA